MIQLHLKCLHCKHDLHDYEHKIDGNPSICLLFELNNLGTELKAFYNVYSTFFKRGDRQ
jgi:hypothetical protein